MLQGTGPTCARRRRLEAGQLPTTQMFVEAALAYLKHLKAQRAGTKWTGATMKQWVSMLKRFAFPKIGKMNVHEIKHTHIAAILATITLAKGTGAKAGRWSHNSCARALSAYSTSPQHTASATQTSRTRRGPNC